MNQPLGAATASVVAQGPISIVATVPVEAERDDDDVWQARPQWHLLETRWAIDGCAPHAARELTELIDPAEWLTSSGRMCPESRRTLRRELECRLVEAAERALIDWLAQACSIEGGILSHDRAPDAA